MNNRSNGGCLGIFIAIAAIAFLFKAIMEIGSYLAIIMAIISLCLYSKEKKLNELGTSFDTISLANMFGIGSILFVGISLFGDYGLNRGFFKNNEINVEQTAQAKEIIPKQFRGSWTSDGDCSKLTYRIIVFPHWISFQEASFTPEYATQTGSDSVRLVGRAFVGSSLSSMGSQTDSISLTLSADRKTLSLDGTEYRRCFAE